MADYTDLTGEYTIDPEHSRLGFVARHAMVTKVRGSFNEFEGTVKIDGEDPSKSSATVVIKTASIDTRNEQRDGHLRTNDFLDIEKYPEITFSTTGIREAGDEEFEVTGDLTIKDVTKSVTIPFEFGGAATDPFGNFRVGFEGKLEINRKDFNVTWNAPLETGGVLVGEKVTLEFEVSAIKKAS
ncbi:YceI family protein [Phytoactinopolyspora halotolerans]|uniref:Polyisoprenoid-binding protein n=1 Tax=Phytoactinopolyspora halotolerans TaxID=1981512 RepID=A0A6L9SF70_9ACTN|nr:YceI family protein [Phytoactinopolyspora halotolerans]NEE02680.1 polyisoprenoid-binding protein [Phytoactinopolyspora halotolerans]